MPGSLTPISLYLSIYLYLISASCVLSLSASKEMFEPRRLGVAT